MKENRKSIELLAPARDAATAVEAIKHGADAVYIGASGFGARASAANSVDDVARVCDFAHQFGARVYATVNTIVYDDELRDVERLVDGLYRAGTDALIVQDMSLLRLDLPPVALHASTQCDIRTPEKARFLEACGFSQLVLARELTLEEIRSIADAVKVPVESFVHGALCVCYSGRCQLSQAVKGRSANRGECAQMCRLPYDLLDGEGRMLVSGRHLLSLRDMNRSIHIGRMIEAGVRSFKIEGRLKDVGYVKNVVAFYRSALDAFLASHSDRYCRSSFGSSEISFQPDLAKSFNRSFTDYFLGDRRPWGQMASILTPKSLGEPLGKVLSQHGKRLRIATDVRLANGDGIGFVDVDGRFDGARVNSAVGNEVELRSPVTLKAGTMIYRTYNQLMTQQLAKDTSRRSIAVDATLRYVDNRLALTLSDERGNRVTHTVEAPALEAARASQQQRQEAELGKLGDTVYRLARAEVLPDLFVPASLLSRLRRESVDLLDRAWISCRRPELRRAEDRAAAYPSATLESADNVANAIAGQFYREHGVTQIVPALECQDPGRSITSPVMTTRYCLRRELGACRLDKKARRSLPEPLFLRTSGALLRVECDCKSCEMRLYLSERQTRSRADKGAGMQAD